MNGQHWRFPVKWLHHTRWSRLLRLAAANKRGWQPTNLSAAAGQMLHGMQSILGLLSWVLCKSKAEPNM